MLCPTKDRQSDIKWTSYTWALFASCPLAEKATPTAGCTNHHTFRSDPSPLLSTCVSTPECCHQFWAPLYTDTLGHRPAEASRMVGAEGGAGGWGNRWARNPPCSSDWFLLYSSQRTHFRHLSGLLWRRWSAHSQCETHQAAQRNTWQTFCHSCLQNWGILWTSV